MTDNNFKKDLKYSIEIVWIIISIAVLTVIYSAVMYPEALLNFSPVCSSVSLYGEQCFMCGMTRAFVQISGGNFSEAFKLNKFSLALFSLFILNEFLFLTYYLKKIKFKKYFYKLNI